MASLRNPRTPKDSSKNCFKELKFVLKLCGVSLEGNESVAYRIYSFVLLFLFTIMYPFLSFLEVFKQDFSVGSTTFPYLAGINLSVVKVGVVLRNRVKFGKLLAKLEQEPFTANPDRGGELEEKLIKKCVWITYVQMMTYWILGSGNVLGSSIVAFSSRLSSDDYHDWKFTYGPLTVLNVTYSPNYEISFMSQFLSLYVLGAQFTSIDLIAAAVMVHTTFQIKILQNNMRRIVLISYENMVKKTGSNLLPVKNPSVGEEIDGSAIPWKYLKQTIKEAVNYHLAIINIAEEIEKIFSDLLLVVFLSTLYALCVLIFQASNLPVDMAHLGFKVLETIFVILQVAIVCYWGEQVMTESQEVGGAAYESNFVGTDLRFQKSLVLIIRRSQNPIMLTAGKFSPISLTTFTWIIQSSYSAFMMLRSMQEQI